MKCKRLSTITPTTQLQTYKIEPHIDKSQDAYIHIMNISNYMYMYQCKDDGGIIAIVRGSSNFTIFQLVLLGCWDDEKAMQILFSV